jgi:hypothetical protein
MKAIHALPECVQTLAAKQYHVFTAVGSGFAPPLIDAALLSKEDAVMLQITRKLRGFC